MSGLILYGYAIYENLEYKIVNRTLINTNTGKLKRLGITKARLLTYLLSRSEEEYILDDDIFIDIFESEGLKCSKSYLWARIRQLHTVFIRVGYERAPLIRYELKGCIIN